MSYSNERDQFIARMTTEGLSLSIISSLLRAATTLQRLAELACSSEAADRDRIPCPASPVDLKGRARRTTGDCLCDDYHEAGDTHGSIPRIALQDRQVEDRARRALPLGWALQTQGDPRGYVLRVIPPSYVARNEGRDRHNLDTIGVPARDSRLRF